MTKHTEVMKQALEALKSCDAAHITDGGRQWYDEKLVDKAVEAIEKALTSVPDWASEAIEQPAPVAKPRKQEPLTDEEIERCMKQAYATVQGRNLERAFAHAIEAKLREKNGIKGDA